MAFTIRDASIPHYKRGLSTLTCLLTRAGEHARTAELDVATLLSAKLAPDMFDLKRQVQVATDHAKGGAFRLAGLDVPKMADDETTLEQLLARVEKVEGLIDGIDPALYDGAETRAIKLVFPWATYDFTGATYLSSWSLPNLYFHVTTAYDILRHQGVPLGKADFLGG